MIILSQLRLNPRSSRVQSEIRNPYELHRTLARAFGDSEMAQREARCLFRVESGTPAAQVVVIVQSRTAPDWRAVRHHAGLSYFAVEPQVKQVELHLSAGQQLAFRLRANPTSAHDGKRKGLYKDDERMDWLSRKAALAGFALESAQITDEDAAVARKRSQDANAKFSSALFDGLLTVRDPDLLLSAVESGIGAGKGFGFGLLSLARAERG